MIALVTTLLIIAIFIGGWILLDNFITSSYGSTGTRNLYQEASRVVAMEQPPVYAGTEKCLQCHSSTGQEWLHSSHSPVACEDCHGPGSEHINSAGPIEVSTSASLCLTCHARLASRPDTFPQVLAEEHSSGLACLQCHNAMHPSLGEPPQMPDIFSEGTECVVCHEEQNLRSMPADHALRSEETCSQCHRTEGEQ